MASRQLSITVSTELADVLETLAKRRGQSRSALVEILLREHPYVRRAVHGVREKEAPAPTVAVKDRRPRRDADRIEVA